MTRHRFAIACLFVALAGGNLPAVEAARYVRFQHGEKKAAYGMVEGDRVRELEGETFGQWTKTDTTHALKDVKLLPPTQPSQVLALAGNYKSHIAGAAVPEKFQIPQPFFKSPSCLVGQDDAIVIPKDARDVHYEAELVIVIGKKCSKVPKEKALEYVFGVTAGNDVSERIWQNDEKEKDIQWWRAKGTDTFGPVGPYIVTGLDYGNLKLSLRLNGEVKQDESTSELIHDIPTTVSFISQHITLHPGDLIFTGTPGATSAIKPGDVVEVELEGVGVLRNPVVAEGGAAPSTAQSSRNDDGAPRGAAAEIATLLEGLAVGTAAEYERIPAIWRVAIEAGKRNDAGELRQLLSLSIPKLNQPACHWEVVVIGGGIINGLSQQGVWPRVRIAEVIDGSRALKLRWSRLVELSSQMADDDSVPSGTRYDALRILGADDFPTRGKQLVKYLDAADAELQMGAVSGLSDMESTAAAESILSSLPKCNDANRRLAVEALMRTGDRRALLQQAVDGGQVDSSLLTPAESQQLRGVARTAKRK